MIAAGGELRTVGSDTAREFVEALAESCKFFVTAEFDSTIGAGELAEVASYLCKLEKDAIRDHGQQDPRHDGGSGGGEQDDQSQPPHPISHRRCRDRH